MPIRITGMNSGLDTESIITELMKVQQTKVDKVKKQQTKLQWKQDAWKTLNTKVHSFFTGTLNNMRTASDYSKKTTDISNSSVASVVTSDSAMNATQKMTIKETAASGYLTGGQLNGSYTKSSKLTDLGIEEGSSFSVTVNGKTTDVTVTSGMTINQLLSNLQSAGVDANFDEKNQRFFISSKKSGVDNDFSLTASNSKGTAALEKLQILSYDTASLAEYKKYKDMDGDITATQAAIDAEVTQRLTAYLSQRTTLTETLNKQQEQITTAENSYRSKYSEEISAQSSGGLDSLITAKKAEIESLKESGTEADLKIATDELSELQEKKTYVDAYEKSKTSLASTQTSLDAIADYVDEDGNAKSTLITEATSKIEAKIQTAKDLIEGGMTGSDAVRISGSDAVITLNGMEYKSTSNVFEVNGLTITVLGNKGDEVTLTTRQDTDGIYDMIKKFIKEYNSLINEMDKLYNAESSKGYEPLTSDEKDEMSDSEVEEWETKIKDSILRGDSNLSTIASGLKSIMLGGVEVNGSKVYLANFGIETLGYFSSADNEKNAYHISGDADDSSVSTNEDKLKAAIASDPDSVIEFFSGLSQKLYTNLNSLTSSTDFRSFGSIYDDKKMKEDYNNYTTKIKQMEEKLKAMEDKYYNQFSAMETALAKLQSNQSAVTSLLGG
ncbi:flagellar hook-associated protein 2 [Kineothrix alysoides]|uniref:Flagellar hook-associated protein 2 n=1 Tax=Kineothrix alysoides TaxID=1469948 RepID=A0A4R1QKA7_9FIRM|nr:flagellar filament capping protein FliD [Kineothrix alysoides]TCL54016.1 flagellar hook-associated protein 2 [Kineothrix alysoides]